jgi:LysM repeat protein
MAYQEINQYNSPNFTPGTSANAVWGMGNRVVKSITIHWWGDPANRPTFEGTIAYLCRQNGNTSAHVIAEAGRVAWIVDGTNCAWHAGNPYGNTTSIGIECNPRASDGDYQTIGELVRDIRKIYGDIPLVPHRDWQSTACPGVYDLGRIDQIARNAYSAPKPAPTAPENPYKAPSTGLITRKVTQSPAAWVRTAPSSKAPMAKGYEKGLAPGATLSIQGYVKGEDPFKTGDDAWFKTKSGFYVWVNAAGNSIAGVPWLGDMSASVSPKPVPVPAPVQRGANEIHWIVERGDTLAKIAQYYYGKAGTAEVNKIAAHNGIKNVNSLAVGQKVYIPGPLVWTVEAPDTYSSIAAYYGLDADYLARKNGDTNRNSEIYIGNIVQIIP